MEAGMERILAKVYFIVICFVLLIVIRPSGITNRKVSETQ